MTKKLALSVGIAVGPEPSRADEYKAVQKAAAHGFDMTLEDGYSDETVYIVEGELVPGHLDYSTDETLLESLENNGYEIVDLFEWSAKQTHDSL